ncbi:hypothetical protein C0992_005104 [Termitomyces sp. T32_za158]|nr:hypothetical protein C0992_005104 [Termitomyces sp. T32_za158]
MAMEPTARHGTAAGGSVGVARAATIIAVKVLGDNGSGFVSDIISGLDWVHNQASTSGRPSVASMSLSANQPSVPFDDAVTSLTSIGVHAIVAAGNNNIDAGNVSPVRATGAVAVGASNIADSKASFSNYGSVVALFAPGENIISAYIGGTTTLAIYSGTSQATPHVAGLAAYLISSRGNTTPANMRTNLKNLALNGVLTNIPTGTVNQLAQNGLAPK